jgi:hypothetical protein
LTLLCASSRILSIRTRGTGARGYKCICIRASVCEGSAHFGSQIRNREGGSWLSCHAMLVSGVARPNLTAEGPWSRFHCVTIHLTNTYSSKAEAVGYCISNLKSGGRSSGTWPHKRRLTHLPYLAVVVQYLHARHASTIS